MHCRVKRHPSFDEPLKVRLVSWMVAYCRCKMPLVLTTEYLDRRRTLFTCTVDSGGVLCAHCGVKTTSAVISTKCTAISRCEKSQLRRSETVASCNHGSDAFCCVQSGDFGILTAYFPITYSPCPVTVFKVCSCALRHADVLLSLIS